MHNPPHPGEALREDILPALNMTLTSLARHLIYSRRSLSSVLNRQVPITADLAVDWNWRGLAMQGVISLIDSTWN